MVIPSPRSISFLLSTTILIIFLTGYTQTQLLPIVDDHDQSSSNIQTYIVHVQSPNDSTTELLTSEDRENWYRSFLPNATLDSGEPRLVHSYLHVISGFAVRLTPEELRAMESMDGFLSAYPDRHHPLLTTYTPSFLELNSWNGLWQSSSYGQGVIIGVLDTGIVPNHASFSDKGMPPPPRKWRGCCQFNAPCNTRVPSICNNKLVGAVNLGFGSSPLDKLGHGTHTAGTAAGNYVSDAEVLGHAKGRAVGMAPRAHLAAYKVCTEIGGHDYRCSDSGILAGIDRAIGDGVDVLSLSLGSPDHMYRDSVAKGTFAAMEKGIITSACAGNEGITPNAIANDAPWILTVGASSIDRVVRAIVRLGNGMEFMGESAYQPEQGEFDSTMMPIEYPGVVDTDQKKACQKGALDDLNVTGKAVLCGIGFNDPVEKGEIVKAAGGAALIVLNQKWDGFTTKSEPHVLPAAHVNHVDALKIVNYFTTATNPTATIIFQGTKYGARKSPAVASFSSRGPSLRNGGILKPDIIGPGVNILAAWHTEVGPNPTAGSSTSSPFNFGSGCSMATPHLAGIAALLKGSHPDWSPAAIKSAIMTTAHIRDRDGDPITDEKSIPQEPASLFAMGAGHVNPPKANDPGLIYDIQPEDYIGYLCGLGYTDNQVATVVRRRIQCSQIQKKIHPEDLNYPSISVSLGSHDERRVTRTVTNVGEADEVYRVEIDEPKGAEVEVSPEKLKFSKLNQNEAYEVKIKAKKNSPGKGEYSEGYLTWVSNKHVVRSPITVKF